MGPPYPTPAEIRFLTESLNLRPDFEWMQDWPLEVADGARLREFCDLYEEGASNEKVQVALMHLILCSLDDAMPRGVAKDGVLAVGELEAQINRIDCWLRRDFERYAQIIDYWRSGNHPDPEYGFAISPLMRRIWNENKGFITMDIDLLERLRPHFPQFVAFLQSEDADIEDILPPLSPDQITALGRQHDVELPLSFKTFLGCMGGFRAMGDLLHLDAANLFIVSFPTYPNGKLKRGQTWLPPAEGMLCFADYWLYNDGDQLLFEVGRGLVDGEYPVFYYNHSAGSVQRVADSFGGWLETIDATDIADD